MKDIDSSTPAPRLVALGGLLLVVLACGSGQEGDSATDADQVTGQEVRQELDEAASAVKEYAFENKDEFEAWARKRLSSLDERIAALEERGEELGEQAGDEWARTAEDLRTRRRQLDAQLDQLRGSSADAWDELQKGFREGRRDLVKALEAAAEKFGDDG